MWPQQNRKHERKLFRNCIWWILTFVTYLYLLQILLLNGWKHELQKGLAFTCGFSGWCGRLDSDSSEKQIFLSRGIPLWFPWLFKRVSDRENISKFASFNFVRSHISQSRGWNVWWMATGGGLEVYRLTKSCKLFRSIFFPPSSLCVVLFAVKQLIMANSYAYVHEYANKSLFRSLL